jgi:hypothetical protein
LLGHVAWKTNTPIFDGSVDNMGKAIDLLDHSAAGLAFAEAPIPPLCNVGAAYGGSREITEMILEIAQALSVVLAASLEGAYFVNVAVNEFA